MTDKPYTDKDRAQWIVDTMEFLDTLDREVDSDRVLGFSPAMGVIRRLQAEIKELKNDR